MVYHVVHLPEEIEREIAYGPGSRARARGFVGDVELDPALMPRPGRTHYFLFSKSVLKTIGAREGSLVPVEFELRDPDEVTVPEDVEEALEADPLAAAIWDRLPAGTRRTLLVPVTRTKFGATRTEKIAALIESCRSSA